MNMKTIIVSDLHLSHEFDQKKFDYLYNLFSSCDQLIVNGDFWSYYSTTFDAFLQSDWKKLFPLMKKKKTLYLYGNHDRAEYMDDRMQLFSVSQHQELSYTFDGLQFHIEHGHLFSSRQSVSNEQYMKLMRLTHFDHFIHYPAEKALYRIFGLSRMSHFFSRLNTNIEKQGKKYTEKGLVLVTSHTHVPCIDTTKKFVNSGFILHGYASYIVLENNMYSLHEERYA
jgi:predicted phosphodiesterase